jgi:glycosyltransferase involved in cell wall biosynthesis
VISVIVPTYNSGNYIREALDSVLCQTYTDYEIIIIDDGSTDDTGKIIKECYPTVSYYYIEQKGAACARNYGIRKARGELVAFLDADDRWLPEKLEKQSVLFDIDKKLGLVFTENHFFNEHGIIDTGINKRNMLMSGDVVKNIFLNSYVVTSTVMVLRSALDAVGMFEEGLAVAEDDNLWMRLAMKYGIELIDEPLVLYRITEGSLSRTRSKVFEGVKKNIELIEGKYPELFHRLGKGVINKKYADLYFSEGYHWFANEQHDQAKSYFAKSICYDPFKLKAYMYYSSCLLPQVIIDKIKQLKNCSAGK